MNELSDKTVAAMSLRLLSDAKRAQGAVKQVDTVEREITVHLPIGLAVFDVPSDCRILLRGEPIKLRLIQPRDQIRITFIDQQGRLTAQVLEVQPDTGSSRLSL